MKNVLSLFFLFFVFSLHATTWGEAEVDDPFSAGNQCKVSQPMSYGSYIYQWDSKYDQVFWPYTDPNAIWYCESSGYVAFMQEFKKLSDKDKLNIQKYLQDNPLNEVSSQSIQKQLKTLYAIRQFDERTRNRHLRVFAQLHQKSKEYTQANEYRKLAYQDIISRLEEPLDEIQKIEYLYLAANYSRQFGLIKESDDYLTQVEFQISITKTKDAKAFADYIQALIPETKNISTGGSIVPKRTK